ncbi:hypothetical protein [Microtetraspora malaysiensis]|uniref:hypothetical protein n=1 Tax=Microtetraspora malaysiensis TaxID=161358 RepID=UPI000B125166|nr:hypothetical protein [Microtetraspora malaysiensis]
MAIQVGETTCANLTFPCPADRRFGAIAAFGDQGAQRAARAMPGQPSNHPPDEVAGNRSARFTQETSHIFGHKTLFYPDSDLFRRDLNHRELMPEVSGPSNAYADRRDRERLFNGLEQAEYLRHADLGEGILQLRGELRLIDIGEDPRPRKRAADQSWAATWQWRATELY